MKIVGKIGCEMERKGERKIIRGNEGEIIGEEKKSIKEEWG